MSSPDEPVPGDSFLSCKFPSIYSAWWEQWPGREITIRWEKISPLGPIKITHIPWHRMKEEVIFFIAAQTTRNQTINDVNRILLPLLLPDKPTPMLGSPPFDKFAGNFQRLYLSKSEIERSVVETGTDKEKSYFFVYFS